MMSPILWRNIEDRLDTSLPGWRSRVDAFDQVAAVADRAAGKTWSDDNIFKGLLLAVLSNNTDWSKVERVQAELAELFSGFSLESYARLPACEVGERIVPWFLGRKAGSVTLRRDLVNLIDAARILFEHSSVHGSAESYFTSLVRQLDGDPKQAALRLGSPGKDKLPGLGVPLAAEALKNLGFDVAKPDRHVKRAVASFGLVPCKDWPGRNGRAAPAFSSGRSCLAVMEAVQEIATAAGRPVVLVDNAIWMLCAKSGLYLTNPELSELASDIEPSTGGAEALDALIRSWTETQDAGEHRETIGCLVDGLNTDRTSSRKLFPEELKGRSW